MEDSFKFMQKYKAFLLRIFFSCVDQRLRRRKKTF